MKISVVLAVFNEDKHLPQCLQSLEKQQGVDLEIIVVDDGSYKAIDKNELGLTRFDLFKFFRINHAGPALARNFGVEAAQGEILVFLDGDMYFEPNFIWTLIQPIVTSQAKGTFSTEEFVANWDNPVARCINYENGLPEKRRIDPKKADMVKDFRAILKSEYDRVGGFDNIGYTDTWSLTNKLGYLPTPTQAVYYHYNPETYKEAFMHAMWIGARERKLGIAGKIVAAIRATAPFSVVIGLLKALKYKDMTFVKFKLLYDLGTLGGVMNSIVNGSPHKT